MPLPNGYRLPQNTTNPDAPKKLYDPLPQDTYQVEILDITPEVETFQKTGETRNVLKLTSVVLNEDFDFTGPENGEQKARGRRVWFSVPEIPLYAPRTGGRPTSLYTFVSNVMGHPLTRQECQQFSPEMLLNKQVKIIVDQRTSKTNGKVYNKVTGTMQIRKDMKPFDPDEFKESQEAAEAKKVF